MSPVCRCASTINRKIALILDIYLDIALLQIDAMDVLHREVVLAAGRRGLPKVEDLVGIIVGEFYAASEGIGYAISRFGDTYRLPEMFAAIFLLMIAAVALTEGMRKLESVLAPWKTTQETR